MNKKAEEFIIKYLAEFRCIACDIAPDIAEDSGQPEWCQGELDDLFNRAVLPILEQAYQQGYDDCCKSNGILYGEDAERLIREIYGE